MKTTNVEDTPVLHGQDPRVSRTQVSVEGGGCAGPMGKSLPLPQASPALPRGHEYSNNTPKFTVIAPFNPRGKVPDGEIQTVGSKVTCPRSHIWETVGLAVQNAHALFSRGRQRNESFRNLIQEVLGC